MLTLAKWLRDCDGVQLVQFRVFRFSSSFLLDEPTASLGLSDHPSA